MQQNYKIHTTMQYMKTMYSECKLIHADFSAYNLLWDGTSKLYVIDVGQSVDLSHPGAMSFLLRDCTNIIKVCIHAALILLILIIINNCLYSLINLIIK